jgi:peptidoglycan/LPS O-acetylase OafA/YrhL
MVANRAINQDSFNYPIWSVSVELWIYLLFFVTVRFVSRSFIINLMIVGACLWAESKDIKNPLIECAKLFYIGGLMAILRRHLTSRTVAIASTCCAWVIGFVATRWLWTKYGTTPDTFMRIFSCSAAPILLFSFAHIPRLPRVVEKTIETAGNTTYSSYLLHFPIQILVALVCAYNGWIIPMYERGFFLAFMIGTIGSAYFVYRYFEFPAQRLLRRVKIVVDSSPRP